MTSPSDRPARATATSPGSGVPFQEYVRRQRAAVDAALERLLPSPPACPPLIAEAVRYSVFAGGKRLRPVLALAAADAVTGGSLADDEAVMPAACAIEMIHTYSLIHDDLPAMDDDTQRRGRPTSHVVYGEGMAVLVGDGLLTEAFRVLARHPCTSAPDVAARKLRVLARVAEAAGAAGMVGGQVVDLEAAGQLSTARPRPAGAAAMDAAGLDAMHARKTGALIRAAAVAGAVMAGAPDAAVAAVDAYAGHLGLAFQIVDDILDVEGDPATLGKTTGKDAAAGKPTYPGLNGLGASRRLAAEAIGRARASLAAAGLGGRLDDIADWVLHRSH
ncbi:MAG: polyprenyl synthetase family protein [Acidobacteria bacterium]|nr:polyprenyl synthetase family protein [Acidobacteriota bacterium]